MNPLQWICECLRPRKRVTDPDEASITGPAPKVIAVDFLKQNNEAAHHTNEFDSDYALIIRRGQRFTMRFTCDGRIRSSDELTLILEKSKGVEYQINDIVSEKQNEWLLEKMDTRNSSIEFDITFPPSCQCGILKLKAAEIKRGQRKVTNLRNEEIVILFNAWCKDDPVYLLNEKERQEYVLNDQGFIWYGAHNNIGKMPWFFGQFEKPVLECAFLLLKMSGLEPEELGDPVLVTRKLSALVNSNDDNGILVGNWSGDYSNGAEPTSWKGSLRIITQYMDKRRPVQFGQCWVFSGVFTALMRSLGIPSRSVTNFRSAHDTDANLTVDNHFFENMESAGRYDGDSIWNFHVWNEAWMRRDDLTESGFGGWQALDATPQEKSRGVFCTGPAPVQAIKHGRVDLLHDSKFVFAEVNATVKHWEVDQRGTKLRELYSDSKDVGRFISTKSVASDNRLDVTDNYKFPEGTVEENAAFSEARKYVDLGDRERSLTSALAEDLDFDFVLPQKVMIGSDVEVKMRIRNMSSSEERMVKLMLAAQLIRYTGYALGDLQRESFNLQVKAKESVEVPLKVTAQDYIDLLKEDAGIKFVSIATVFETKQTFATQKDFRFEKPDIKFQVQQPLKVGKSATITVQVENPLNLDLQDCVIRLEGPGLDSEVVKELGQIRKGQCAEAEISVSPRRIGRRKYIASLSSKRLHNVCGELQVRIVE